MKRGTMTRHSRLKADPEKTRAWQQRSRKPMKRSPLKARNEGRVAKRHREYTKVLRSAFHRKLRYLAWERAKGLCECDRCAEVRRLFNRTLSEIGPMAGFIGPHDPTAAEVVAAFTPVPVWFVNKGGEPWQRFRCKEGSIHHRSYKWYGQEKEGELELVIFTWNSCHARIESEHGTRRRYLTKGAT